MVDSPFQDIKCQSSEIDVNTIENNILKKRYKNGVTPDEGDIVICKKYLIMVFAEESKINNEISCIV